MSSLTVQQDAGSRPFIGQLLYRSISAVTARGALELSDILEEARAKNRQQDLTGVLTIVDDQFIQILEGPDTGLDALLASLDADPRHADMQVLERRHVDQRSFADWTMVSPRLTPSCVVSLSALLAADEFRLDAYLPILMSALDAQDRLATRWQNPGRSPEPA